MVVRRLLGVNQQNLSKQPKLPESSAKITQPIETTHKTPMGKGGLESAQAQFLQDSEAQRVTNSSGSAFVSRSEVHQNRPTVTGVASQCDVRDSLARVQRIWNETKSVKQVRKELIKLIGALEDFE
jgi:hypothetical protein